MNSPLRRCVFLDRDGVINVRPAVGAYVRTWAEFEFLPNVTDWIRLFNKLDFLVIVVTNQRGVALHLMTERDLLEIHGRMTEALAKAGAQVDDIFYCPHDEGACACRKPRPGLIWRARDKWNIELQASLLIGDTESDAELALRCGMSFLRSRHGRLI